MSDLLSHLRTKTTHVCRCWAVIRKDGRVFGFTDHDRQLDFEGIEFKADSGMTARALEYVTGLATDNSEAVGALSGDVVTEKDIIAGRFDGAKVSTWLVNWQDTSQRELKFSGTIGELRRADGAFHAELRGVSEPLNTPVGRVFQKACSAVLGDVRCQVDLDTPGYRIDAPVHKVFDNRVFHFRELPGFDAHWFEHGRLKLKDGEAVDLSGAVKNDRMSDGVRIIELWEQIRAQVNGGDTAELEAGCDKRKETCRLKFANFLNFRGFPHIPGEDWLVGYPTSSGRNDGRSRHQ